MFPGSLTWVILRHLHNSQTKLVSKENRLRVRMINKCILELPANQTIILFYPFWMPIFYHLNFHWIIINGRDSKDAKSSEALNLNINDETFEPKSQNKKHFLYD